MTNNPTDTNQASEDELQESIDALLERWRNILTHKGDGNGDEYYQSDVVADIQEIIRTEKLKLLEEVRERVVGEDECIDIQSEFDKIDVPHLETDRYPGLDGVRQASRNLCREHQRKVLTKLEAEL